VLAAVLHDIGRREKLGAGPLLISKLRSPDGGVRAAAVAALGNRPNDSSSEAIVPLLDDYDARVRCAAATATARLQLHAACDRLLRLTRDSDAEARAASIDALRELNDPRALAPATEALRDSYTQVAALRYLGEFGNPDPDLARQVTDTAVRNPSAETLHTAIGNLMRWGSKSGLAPNIATDLERATAEIHGASGVLIHWNVLGPLAAADTARIVDQIAQPDAARDVLAIPSSDWRPQMASMPDFAVSLQPPGSAAAVTDAVWLCVSDLWVSEDTTAQFLASANGSFRVWINGQSIHDRSVASAFQPDSDRFNGVLRSGANRVTVQVSGAEAMRFHVRFRRKSSRAEHEQLVQAALARPGNPERGRALFLDAEKSLCIKCHRLGHQGERIGPDLTGVGNRFSRIHIIESILEPSRTIAPSFESTTIALSDGRVISGLRIEETELTMSIADNQGNKMVLEKTAIEERRTQPSSIMPDGIEKRLTVEEFVDLVSFLAGQRKGL
jgi:putative heme-binding domain-containing protein